MQQIDLPDPAPPGFERVVYTSTEPEVQDLVVYRNAEGLLYSEWEFTADDILRIMRGERLRLWVWTGNQPLHPVSVGIVDSELERLPATVDGAAGSSPRAH
jgi:hypothetical protein